MDATILEAIPGDNPSGMNLRSDLIYSEIRARVRRARGGVFLQTGEPEQFDPDAEWRFVVRTCRNILQQRSKDLMIAAWWTEAQYALEGFAGLGEGLETLRGLTEKFWEALYPEIEDGDTEARLRVFEWVDTRLAEAVRTASAPGPDQKISNEVRRQRNRDLDACMLALNRLEMVCEEKFGDVAPALSALREALLGKMTAEANLAALIGSLSLEDLGFPAASEAEPDDLPRVPAPPHGGGASPFPVPSAPAPVPPPAVPKDGAKRWEYHAEASHLGGELRLPLGGAQTASDSGQAQVSSSGSAVVAANTQKVEFTLAAPQVVAAKVPFEIFVWAHVPQERAKVLARAREELNVRDVLARTKGPVTIASAEIAEPEDTMAWEGESTSVSFVVTLTALGQGGKSPGVARIYANGIQVAKISFVLSAAGVAESSGVRYRKAFASYASDDRDAVLGRIQGIHKVVPEMEIFLDVASLRSGQNWERELWRVIPASDIFYLFWSHHARNSEWVEKEWRCALRERGIEFIDPVPLESPRESPPPPELSSLLFNDWELAFRRCSSVP